MLMGRDSGGRESRGWLAVAIAVLAGLLLVPRTPGAAGEPARSPEETREIERKVEELERAFRAARDAALGECRTRWRKCTDVRCRQIPTAQASRWEACQEACDAGYERCKAGAYALWPEEEAGSP
jgi:hypothetical protein